MKISRRELWQSAKVLALAFVLSVGVPYALAWTGPTAAPPGNNTPTPINVSATSQVKTGGFWAASLGADGYVRGSTGLCIGSDCRTAWPGGVTSITAGTGITVNQPTGAVTISSTATGAPSGSWCGYAMYHAEVGNYMGGWDCNGVASSGWSMSCPSGYTVQSTGGSPGYFSAYTCVKN